MRRNRKEEHHLIPEKTKLFFVCEHRYYEDSGKKRTGTVRLEFCVCEGELTGYVLHGHREMRILGKNPDGHLTPYYYKYSDLGIKVFLTHEEATALAKKKTERYERIWGIICPKEMPLRRPWLCLLGCMKGEL